MSVRYGYHKVAIQASTTLTDANTHAEERLVVPQENLDNLRPPLLSYSLLLVLHSFNFR